MAKHIRIEGMLDSDCTYLTVGCSYEVLDMSLRMTLVWIIDDEGEGVAILTELSEYECSHLGPNAKAVFI